MRPNAFAGWQRIKTGLNHTVFGLSGTVFNFAFSVIIVRYYSFALWGSFAQLMLMMTFLSQITGWGSRDFLVREFSRNNDTSLWLTSLVSRVFIFVPLLPVFWIYGQGLEESYLFILWCIVNSLLRSFDSVIVFERKFIAGVIIEMIGFAAILLSLFLLERNLTIGTLLAIFIGSALLKVLIYLRVFWHPYLAPMAGSPSRAYLVNSIPYFLPPFIGFLNARADTFAIALSMSEKELGEYYVLVSLLAYCHAIGALALVPFLKNIYRIKTESLKKIKRLFFIGGMAWATLCLAATWFALEYIYQIHFEAPVYLLSSLALPPFFLYYLFMQEFFKNDKPYPVVIINLLAAAVNFAGSLLLIRFFGFLGGLIAFAVMQWVILLGYLIARKNIIPARLVIQTNPL